MDHAESASGGGGARVVVGLDFGTTRRSVRVQVLGISGPLELEKDCGLLRKTRDHRQQQAAAVDVPVLGTYLTSFKLDLLQVGGDDRTASPSGTIYPRGLTVNRVISDYLREIGGFIMEQIQTHYGEQLSMESVQWCVTVPSIWSDSAKRKMKQCMVDAGLVVGSAGGGPKGSSQRQYASPHPLIMVLEPEAASCHCHRNSEHLNLQKGDKLLVVDIGGGTSDIVVQEWVGDDDRYRVREVTRSTGGFCGGTYVDKNFITLMSQKIRCLPEYFQQNPGYKSDLLKRWEEIKRTFGDPLSIGEDIELQLPHKLARAWEDQEREQGLRERESYHEIELSHSEMKAIFDPVVNENLDLIAAQLSQTHDIKVMLVVGGFAGSPYLMTRIKNSFAAEVERIISPPNPGSAVCQGAVALAMNPGAIISRIARKTYGIGMRTDFEVGDPAEYCIEIGNRKKCENRFAIYVQKGSEVAVDHCVTKRFFGRYPRQKEMSVVLYSSDDVSPRYTKGGSAEKEGELVIDISNVSGKRDAIAEVSVSMYFGRSSIEMKVVGLNCGDKSKVHELELPLTFGGVLEGLEKRVYCVMYVLVIIAGTRHPTA
ncbi:unnamed protein product [Sphagnum jensenii]|uniref:Uncharacterized protein n=1 Tax=Sphagnum jensenii TaxID=128206 RepID=A0ABP1BHK5_9BRYO